MPLRLALRQARAYTAEVEQEQVTLAGVMAQQAALVAQFDAAKDTLLDWRSSAVMVLDDHADRIDTLESSALAFDGRVDALEAGLSDLTTQATAALTTQT